MISIDLDSPWTHTPYAKIRESLAARNKELTFFGPPGIQSVIYPETRNKISDSNPRTTNTPLHHTWTKLGMSVQKNEGWGVVLYSLGYNKHPLANFFEGKFFRKWPFFVSYQNSGCGLFLVGFLPQIQYIMPLNLVEL